MIKQQYNGPSDYSRIPDSVLEMAIASSNIRLGGLAVKYKVFRNTRAAKFWGQRLMEQATPDMWLEYYRQINDSDKGVVH